MKKGRTLTPEEKRLWKLVTEGDRKLHKNANEEEDIFFVPSDKPIIPNMILDAPKKRAKREVALGQGVYAGIDRNTAERFRKGKSSIDATLDLHGLTRDKAFASLKRFIQSHYQRGSRCLLIITGKGIGKNEEGERLPGVLKQSLPAWLATDELSPMILAFDKAQQKDGGSGAYYVLLRRKR
jgi:DNA-nicking Smr family endonuclease